MSNLSAQAVVSGKTVQVVLQPEEVVAKIYIVDSDGSSYRPRTMSVQEYVDAGMSDDEMIRHILDVVSESLEQLDRVQSR
ncbi:hypothetical protein [Burkholderia vietnamiensis]|uniref:hypothetical protein n=1 Tax=Burkholderia vietnamiensis TaxID=60552 RepID=UPI000754FB92|nr:hypothetical protein [Burkholderia vietnamiensis]KVE71609.1 hypothetical protein WI98_25265 [Burkholderia vietnamiensis]KVG05528.1 hypothetical protein WJ24_27710 [Burkholderia vietnamiensis]